MTRHSDTVLKESAAVGGTLPQIQEGLTLGEKNTNNSRFHRARRSGIAGFVSLLFASFWAVIQWPWFPSAVHPATNNRATGWLLCLFFASVSVGLKKSNPLARKFGIAATGLLLVALLLAVPVLYVFSGFLSHASALQYIGALLFSFVLLIVLLRQTKL
jgi:hypothetical protein